MIEQKDWKWFGDAGHFICGQWCRFHLATQIGDHLVSTVGRFVHPRYSGGSEQKEAAYLAKNPDGEDIGHNRKYETMSFKVGKPCDAEGCGCGLPAIAGGEIDFQGYNDAASAAQGHYEICMKVAGRQ